MGFKNVWIPAGWRVLVGSGGVRVLRPLVYVAPELIVHYIEAHGYRPPDEFIQAVLRCPPQDSPAFHKRMSRFPFRWLHRGNITLTYSDYVAGEREIYG